MRLIIALLLATATVSPLPPPSVPGEADPALTKAVICAPGFSTKKIRPPAWFTNSLKKKQMKALGLPGSPAIYEEDHLIPLELGGAPRSERNLWPEPRRGQWGAAVKDRLENRLHVLVCSGKVDLATAQHDIATNWIAAYKQYVGGVR